MAHEEAVDCAEAKTVAALASRLVQGNLSLHKVSKLLGHTTPTMTRKYAHLVPEDVAEEARHLLNAS